MSKNRNGITLIALVVTIIVLLILAGVSIITLTGDNGIITRVSGAKHITKLAEIEEQANLIYTEELIDKLSGKTNNDIALATIFTKLAEKKYNVEQKTTGAPTVTGVVVNHETLNIVQGGSATITATVATNSATGSYYAIVDGKYYRMYIPDGQNKVKIEKTETDVSQTASAPKATFSSNNSKVEVDEDGNITVAGDATGTATITATAGGETAQCTITIIYKVTSITAVVGTDGKVGAGSTANITVTTTPNSGTETLTYSYSIAQADQSIATVNSSTGVVHGEAVGGPVTVSVTGVGNGTGTEVSTTCTVEVIEVGTQPNIPDLSQISNKKYVTWQWSTTNTVYEKTEHTTEPTTWYDYENGMWANIKTTVNGIDAYWVWIPRFEYKIADATNPTAKKIDVKFVSVGDTADSGYLVHPAFTFGTDSTTGDPVELDGFWVAKFEASAYDTATSATTTASYGGGTPSANSTLKVQVKPGVQSWRSIPTTNIFTVCQNMTSTGGALTGVATDSHMMKNSEWGAVAILSQSKYGIYNPTSLTGTTANGGDNTLRVWTNPNGYSSGAYIYTGYVGNDADAKTTYNSTSAPTNVALYDSATGPKASTTGTVYGVYDMAGGSWEYVAGCWTGNSSKFGTNIDGKYYDVYNGTDTNKTLAITSWNSDYSYFASSGTPVFGRGGGYGDGAGAGVFASDSSSGGANDSYSFRPVWLSF